MISARTSLLLLTLLLTLLLPLTAAAEEVDHFAEHVRSTEPLTPAAQQKTFRLPHGFEIQLVASEPDISKPMNLAFDERGRLWVTSSTEYPFPVKPGERGRDTIQVLEDTDGDGHADKISVFADGLNIPIGIYPYRGGAIAFSIPYLYHFLDHDGDGRADERKILYGPVGWQRDTHGLNNAFRRTFDGWLYVCHGFNNETAITATDGSSVRLHSGNTYRVRVDGSRIEQFTWGQVNPFGMCYDPLGNLYTADCHSLPLTQLLRGGYYPSFGKPHDGLGFVPPMMRHSHGSTAICGVAYYDAENFPPRFRGDLFVGNVWTSRVNRDSLTYDGSTVTAHEEEDLVGSSDPWFRPVDLQIGPDGALYIADFYNRIIGHYEVPLTHPGRDRFRGRIWRVVYTGTHPAARDARLPPSLAELGTQELVEALGHPSLTYRNLAMTRLVDHAGKAAAPAVAAALTRGGNAHMKAHGLWVLERLGALPEAVLAAAARDDHAEVRVHAMRILSEKADWTEADVKLARSGLSDANAFVQRAAADALGQHPHPDRLRDLLDLLHRVPATDPLLRHTVRIALRRHLEAPAIAQHLGAANFGEGDERELASVALAVNTVEAGALTFRYISTHDESHEVTGDYLRHAARNIAAPEVEALATFVQRRFAADVDFQLALFTAIGAGLEQRGTTPGRIFHDWGRSLAERLLGDAPDEVSAWTNRPVPGKPRSADPWAIESRLSNDGDARARFFSSLPHGERLTGILRSPVFTAPEKLSFYLAGHDGAPDRSPGGNNFVRLVDAESDDVLAERAAPRHDTARRVGWGLTEHAGREAHLEIVDGDTAGAYAWIAAGRFDPPVAPIPRVAPSRTAGRRRAAAKLIAELRLETLQPQLRALVLSDSAGIETAAAAAQALASFQSQPALTALARVLADPSLPAVLEQPLRAALAALDAARAVELLASAMRQSARGLQLQLAQSLASTAAGAQTLFELVASGHASPRLLLQPSVRERLRAAEPQDADTLIQELTADLPPENDRIQEAIARKLEAFRSSTADATGGAAVFEKHCSACHRIEGRGGLIGPQLDGIGGRGLERVVEDLLDPNRNVDAAFGTTAFVLDDGRVLAGLYRREEGQTVVLSDTSGAEVSIPSDRIVRRISTRTSLMPENFVDTVTPEELNSLIAFLLSQAPGRGHGDRGTSNGTPAEGQPQRSRSR